MLNKRFVCGPRLSTGIAVLNRFNDASTMSIHLPLGVETSHYTKVVCLKS